MERTNKFLAKSSIYLLGPIIFSWLLSFYVTRQRELILINRIRDYKRTFPHIFNIFAVDFSRLLKKIGVDEKNSGKSKDFSIYLSTFIRVIMSLIICMPMVLIFSYSYYLLFFIVNTQPSTLNIALSLIFFIVLILQIISIAFQEFLMLWRKSFHA